MIFSRLIMITQEHPLIWEGFFPSAVSPWQWTSFAGGQAGIVTLEDEDECFERVESRRYLDPLAGACLLAPSPDSMLVCCTGSLGEDSLLCSRDSFDDPGWISFAINLYKRRRALALESDAAIVAALRRIIAICHKTDQTVSERRLQLLLMRHYNYSESHYYGAVIAALFPFDGDQKTALLDNQ